MQCLSQGGRGRSSLTLVLQHYLYSLLSQGGFNTFFSSQSRVCPIFFFSLQLIMIEAAVWQHQCHPWVLFFLLLAVNGLGLSAEIGGKQHTMSRAMLRGPREQRPAGAKRMLDGLRVVELATQSSLRRVRVRVSATTVRK